MFAVVDPALAGLIAAVVAALGAYLAAARRFSGKIASSDAAELWAESKSIRDWSTERIGDLERRVAICEARHEAVTMERDELTREVRDLRATIAGLRSEVVTLTDELRQSRERVQQLEANRAN